jgi:hypothetical protein
MLAMQRQQTPRDMEWFLMKRPRPINFLRDLFQESKGKAISVTGREGP